MRRTKINDYCEFPFVLNLEAYSKEGLEKKEKGPAAQTPMKDSSYYEYELTGILVHTGTAESGHYYSFIREREPCEPGKERKWYHFNDTDVEIFDPKDIGKQCFGGFDTMLQWDHVQQKQVPRFSNKINNAYMLFYERIKPERKETSLILDPTLESKLVPRTIFNKIWEENMAFLIDKNIFEPDYFTFLWSVVSLPNIPSTVIPYDAMMDASFDSVKLAIELGTRFIIATLAHSKEKPGLKEYANALKELYSKHIPACKWFMETVIRDPTWLRQILLQCTISETREILAPLIVHIMNTLIPYERSLYDDEDPADEEMEIEQKSSKKKKVEGYQPMYHPLFPKRGTPKALVLRFIDTMLSLLREAPANWHNFAQFFLIFKEFAAQGPLEQRCLLSRNIIAQLIDVYLADDSPHHQLFKQKRNKMGDKFTYPNLQYMFEAISVLVRSSNVNTFAPPSRIGNDPLPLSSYDHDILFCEAFYIRSLRENIHPKSTAEIATHLCWENLDFSCKILDVCSAGINAVDHDGFAPYLTVMSALFNLNDSVQDERIKHGLNGFLEVVDSNSRYRNATYFSLRYLQDLSGQNSLVREWMFQNKERWIESYLIGYATESIREVACSIVLLLIPGYPSMVPTEGKPLQDPSKVELSEESSSRHLEIYEYLISLFKEAKSQWLVNVDPSKTTADCDSNAFRLIQYFRLLTWFTISPRERRVFISNYAEFWDLFISGDSNHYPCDENKKECTIFWYHCLSTAMPEMISLISNAEKNYNRMVDFFISISPSEKFVRYNQQALPSFYSILCIVAKHSEKFLNSLIHHQNWNWAIKYLYLETNEYAQVANVLLDLYKHISGFSSNFTAYRNKQIAVTIQSDKLSINAINVLRLLEALIRGPEEAYHFTLCRGLDILYKYLDSRLESDSDRIAPVVEHAIGVYYKALHWLADENMSDAHRNLKATMLQTWENHISRKEIVNLLFSLIKKYPQREKITEVAYKLVTALATIDTIWLQSALRQLLQFDKNTASAAMETELHKSKAESFYRFICGLCDKCANQNVEVVDVAITYTIEALPFPSVSVHYYELLQKLWDNPATHEALKMSQKFHSMILQIMGSDTFRLDDAHCELLLSKVCPQIKDQIPTDQRTKLVNDLQIQLQNSVQSLKKAIEEDDPGFMETSLMSTVQSWKALNVLVENSKLEMVAQHKETFVEIVEMATMAKLQIFERYMSDLQNLVKLWNL